MVATAAVKVGIADEKEKSVLCRRTFSVAEQCGRTVCQQCVGRISRGGVSRVVGWLRARLVPSIRLILLRAPDHWSTRVQADPSWLSAGVVSDPSGIARALLSDGSFLEKRDDLNVPALAGKVTSRLAAVQGVCLCLQKHLDQALIPPVPLGPKVVG